MQSYTEEYLKGGVVAVAYNPENVNQVWLLKDGGFHPFELIRADFGRRHWRMWKD